jgi:predicted XRE-type DNA-binding protein
MELTKQEIEQIESELVTVSNPFLSSHEDKEVAIEKYYRAQLMAAIRNIFLDRGIKPAKAAELLGVKQPRISELVNGKVSAFSVEKLFMFLYKLGVEVDFAAPDGVFSAEVTQKPVVAAA